MVRLLLWVVVLLVLLLAWDRPASGDDDPCPEGYVREWVDPIGTVCRDLETGDPVRINYARRMAGLPSYDDVWVDPPSQANEGESVCGVRGTGWYHNPDTDTCNFRATPASEDEPQNPKVPPGTGCLGPHCRFEDSNRTCGNNKRDYDLWKQWGACQPPAEGPWEHSFDDYWNPQ